MASRRRTRPRDDSDEDSASDGVESRHTVLSNSIRRESGKRARIERDAESQLPTSPPILPESFRSSGRETANGDGALSTASAVHQPGSILRVTLKNFVTYTAAEFHPGPSLNMVIGPNGTGKSTLVCAICLGLGSKPETLGRAKDISEFIKHGAREAEIEIELAADPARHTAGNPVVRRVIRKEKSTWFINGRTSNLKGVLELCRSFSIQIDNLCQFLPQDRVVEFAALNPVELLRETQRAAAPERMTEWHDELKKLRSQQRTSLELRKNNSEQFKNLEGRQNLQRADVERLRERAEIQDQLAAMKRLRPFPQYMAARDAWKEARNSRKEAARDLALLEQQVEPALQAVSSKEDYVAKTDRAVQQRDRLVKSIEVKADDILRKQQQFMEKINACDVEANVERETVKKAKQERLRLEKAIKDLERQIVSSDPGDGNFSTLNEEVRELSRRIREKEDLDDASRAKHDNIANTVRSIGQRIQVVDKNLENLRSKSGQQANKLRGFSRDTAAAWDWIQANRDKFAGKVFGPAIIECSLKEQKYAKAFEAAIGQGDVTAITVTDVADYNMLQRELLGTMGLADLNLRSVDRELSSWTPPMSLEELHALGLHGWVLDLINGPDEVLSMLCDNRNIHQMAVSHSDINNEQYEALSRTAINSWVTPSESYRITRRREYGDLGTSTSTQRLREARFFTNQPVDTREEENFKNEKREMQHELEELRTQAEECKADHLRYSTQIKDLKKQRADLEEDKKNRQKAQNEYKKLQPRKEATEAKLEQALADASEYRVRMQTIKDKQEELVLQRAEEALKLMATVSTLQKLQTDLFEAELLRIEGQSDLDVLMARSEEVRNMLDQRKREVDRLKHEEASLKTRAEAVMSQVNAITEAELSEMETELYNLIHTEKKTVEQWEADIEATTARLEMVHEGNPQIIQEFEARAKEIERIRSKLNQLEAELGETEANIAEVRARWEPELDNLVGQISEAFGDNFARIGCAGEVTVFKDEDFDQWAIQIQVRFRETEQLSILDSHRQSGGERAVSTIFYLMALQSLARAPFRVVDEINQGMDPRNERMVHSRIVDIACAHNTSQYFLITPKLLPNLKYHPHMKVHCIASGEYMPEDHCQLDFQMLANKALQVRGVA